jgi:hypothetical protein
MPKSTFRVIDGCPVHEIIAPFIYVCLRDAHTTAASIYRGDDARAILNRHGKHSQYQLYHADAGERAAWGIEGEPDRPGESTHELYSDGAAYVHFAPRTRLDYWMQGFDVPTDASGRVMEAAKKHGWELFRPYHSGVEVHHLNFREQPKPHTKRMHLRLVAVRARLPRR